jgi:hypothetical protein
MHVRSSLDTKNPQQDMPRWAGSDNLFAGRGGKGCHSGWRRVWRRLQIAGPGRFGLGLGRRLDNCLRPAVAAAILKAAGVGSVVRHWAICAHLAHPHATRRGAGGNRRDRHSARQAGDGRLCGEHRNQREGDDLENLFHALQREYHRFLARCVFQITDRMCICYLAAVSASTGTSMSCLRMIRLVAFSVASSKP